MRLSLLPAILLSTQITAAGITAPDGFRVDVFARNLGSPRAVLALEDGTLLVSRPDMNDVVALRDRDGDGRADELRTAVAAIAGAHGLAMRGRTLYVAGVRTIVSAERQPDGSFAAPHEIVSDLPDGGEHPYRTLGAGPDGKLYIAIGSSCTDCIETNPEHAAILQLDADGSNRRIFARGLRRPHALDWNPATGELWGGESGELNRIGDGLHYGWPFCTGRNLVNERAGQPAGISKEKFCKSSEPAAAEVNGAPAGFVFYRGTLFPEGWRKDAFVAAGGEIVRVRFENGKAAIEPFVSGLSGLAGATIAPDGALLASDARNGVVYRVTFGDAAPAAMTSSGEEMAATPVLAKAFAAGGLRSPESVLHDEEQDVYFVSNRGFISRVTPDGKIAELKFIDGLNAPRGMAIRDLELWIADGDQLRVYDRVSGAELQTVALAEHGAVSLHDVAVGPDEAIYATDSDVRIKASRERVRQGDGRIFRVTRAGVVEVVMSGEELRSPSGIAWDGTRFLIAQGYGKEIVAWNVGTATKAVLRGPGAYEGVVVLPNGAIIVSSSHDESLHVAHPGGELRPLFARKPSPAGIGFDRKRNRLLIPSPAGDWLEAWTLPPLEPPKTRAGSKEAPLVLSRVEDRQPCLSC